MKHYYWRIYTTRVIVPAALQRDTGLPGDPHGRYDTGYARTKRELIGLARLDRSEGGRPTITRMPEREPPR
jgi:hypothetical protein